MKKRSIILQVTILVIILLGGLIWYMQTPSLSDSEVKEIVEPQLEKVYKRNFTVTNVQYRWTEAGEIYDVKVKMEGLNQTFTVGGITGIHNIPPQSIIWDIWNQQFEKEVREVFAKHGFRMKNMTANANIPTNLDVPIEKLPSIQQVRNEFGGQFEGNDIQVEVENKFPKDTAGKLKEHQRVFALLQDLQQKKLVNVWLRIDYWDYEQTYEIYTNKGQTTYPYNKPEDLEKTLQK